MKKFRLKFASVMLAMLLGIVITPIITFIAPAKDMERVEKIFACYNKKITVSYKQAISGDEVVEEVVTETKTNVNTAPKRAKNKSNSRKGK